MPQLAGISAGRLLLAIHPSLVSTVRLASLPRREGKAGFVVVDKSELAECTPTDAHLELGRRSPTPLPLSEG